MPKGAKPNQYQQGNNMDLEKTIKEIHEKVHETDTRTQVIQADVSHMKETQKGHNKDIDKLKTDVNKAKGGAKLLLLIALILGILAKIGLL